MLRCLLLDGAGFAAVIVPGLVHLHEPAYLEADRAADSSTNETSQPVANASSNARADPGALDARAVASAHRDADTVTKPRTEPRPDHRL